MTEFGFFFPLNDLRKSKMDGPDGSRGRDWLFGPRAVCIISSLHQSFNGHVTFWAQPAALQGRLDRSLIAKLKWGGWCPADIKAYSPQPRYFPCPFSRAKLPSTAWPRLDQRTRRARYPFWSDTLPWWRLPGTKPCPINEAESY